MKGVRMEKGECVKACGHCLANSRSCVKTVGHESMVLQGGRDDRQHSATWQMGDARSLTFADGRTVDMETGELLGCFPPVDAQALRLEVEKGLDSDAKKREHARNVLRIQYGFDVDTAEPSPGPAPLSAPEVFRGMRVTWHYQSGDVSYGVTDKGHDVMFNAETERLTRIYSPRQRQESVEYARRFTPATASRKFDIPAATIRSWMNRGVG